jgi:hypothetical protein
MRIGSGWARLVILALAGSPAVIGLADCAPVLAFERGRLAHPTMRTSDVAGAADLHVRSVQEGATGGSAGVGGGCGCN